MTFFLRNANDVTCLRGGLMSADWLNKFWRSTGKNRTSSSTVEGISQCKREELAFSKTIDLIPVQNSTTIPNSDKYGYG